MVPKSVVENFFSCYDVIHSIKKLLTVTKILSFYLSSPTINSRIQIPEKFWIWPLRYLYCRLYTINFSKITKFSRLIRHLFLSNGVNVSFLTKRKFSGTDHTLPLVYQENSIKSSAGTTNFRNYYHYSKLWDFGGCLHSLRPKRAKIRMDGTPYLIGTSLIPTNFCPVVNLYFVFRHMYFLLAVSPTVPPGISSIPP